MVTCSRFLLLPQAYDVILSHGPPNKNGKFAGTRTMALQRKHSASAQGQTYD
jgi:hypothetical protein